MTPAAFVALLALAVLWGSAFPAIKVGLDGLSVPHLTLVRHLVASICFLPVLVVMRRRLVPDRRDIPAFFLMGFLGIFVYHLFLNLGEVRVSAGASSLIIAVAPAITALLAWWFRGERLPLAGWVGSMISFVGVVMIVLGDSRELGLNPFAGFVLLAAFATSFYFILQKPMFPKYRPVEVTAWATWAGTVPMLLFLPGLGADVAGSALEPLLASVYLGVFPSAIAYTLFAFALSRAAVTLVSTYLYMIPVFSLLFSWWILGEVPTWLTVLGGAVAIAGIAVVNVAKQRAARAERARVRKA